MPALKSSLATLRKLMESALDYPPSRRLHARFHGSVHGRSVTMKLAFSADLLQGGVPSMTLIIFDLETTGLSPTQHEIIQIAGLKMKAGCWERSEAFETFVKPARRVPGFITGLTGITQSLVDDAPSIEEALMSFARFAGEDTTLIAHNGLRFDMPFIRESCIRSGIPTRSTSAIDSRNFSRQLWGGRGGHGLDAVMQRLGITGNGQRRHDARGDVRMLADAVQLMWRQLSRDYSCSPVPQSTAVLPRVVLGSAVTSNI